MMSTPGMLKERGCSNGNGATRGSVRQRRTSQKDGLTTPNEGDGQLAAVHPNHNRALNTLLGNCHPVRNRAFIRLVRARLADVIGSLEQ